MLSRPPDTAKAFAYLPEQWGALNLYCSNGWAEIDDSIADNALRGVALGRKNWLFAGSDAGGEHAAMLCSLIGTCRLYGAEPELRYALTYIQDWPVKRLRDLLPWKTGYAAAEDLRSALEMTVREKPKRPGFAVLIEGFVGTDPYQCILCKGQLHSAGAVTGEHSTKMLSDRLHQMAKKPWFQMLELERCAGKKRFQVKIRRRWHLTSNAT